MDWYRLLQVIQLQSKSFLEGSPIEKTTKPASKALKVSELESEVERLRRSLEESENTLKITKVERDKAAKVKMFCS
jgi:hypothetical protein